MPDPKYGMLPHYLYGSGTPAEYNAGMTTVAEYKAAPHLAEYQWNHPQERQRLPDDQLDTLHAKTQNYQFLLRQQEPPGQGSEVIHLEVALNAARS